MIKYIKRNAIVIGYILTILTDTIFKLSNDLNITKDQLIWIKIIGAIIAVLSTQTQAIINEKLPKS